MLEIINIIHLEKIRTNNILERVTITSSGVQIC